MTKSAHALRYRCIADAFEKKANYWAGVNEVENPWWLRNVRLYQSRMVEFAALRSKVLIDYLAERGARASGGAQA